MCGYVISAAGDVRWTVAPLVLFIGYNRIWPRNETDQKRGHSVDGVISTNLPGIAWLLIAAWAQRPELLGAFAAHKSEVTEAISPPRPISPRSPTASTSLPLPSCSRCSSRS